MYKVSRYILLFSNDSKNDQQFYIFNTSNGALFFIDKSLWFFLKKNQTKNNLFTKNRILKFPEAEKLILNRSIVKDYTNEYIMNRYIFNILRTSKDNLSLTICPTLDCNMDCIYCFEKKIQINMNQEKANELIDWIERRLSSQRCKILNITWYGGEPLLNVKIIFYISKELKKICYKKEIHFTTSLITNGTLLNKEIINKFLKYNLRFIQITLDGDKEYHDYSRPLKNKNKSSFDIIYKKLINYVKCFNSINFGLRINVGKENQKNVEYLYKMLKNDKLYKEKNFVIGLGHVRPYENTEITIKNCISTYNFSKFAISFYKKMVDDNFNIDILPGYNLCVAKNLNSFVIDPENNIYKCWETVGKKVEMVNKNPSKMVNRNHSTKVNRNHSKISP